MKTYLLPSSFCTADFERLPSGRLYDKIRNETYSDDSQGLIRFKCALITIGNPLRIIAFVIASLAKGLFLLMMPLFKAPFLYAKGISQGLTFGGIKELFHEEFAGYQESLSEALLSPGKALFYGSIVESGAIIGLVDPLRGRKIIGLAEKTWSSSVFFWKEGAIMAPCFTPG